MAYYDEKCGDCSFDSNEDKQKGVCLIKKEFIIEDHLRQLNEQRLTETDRGKISVSASTEDKDTDVSSLDETPVKKLKLDDKNLIKKKFIIEDHLRQLNEQCLTETDKCLTEKISVSASTEDTDVPSWDETSVKKIKPDNKKEKLRGQNKARPVPFKISRELHLCPWIADQIADEPEKKCLNQRCTFLHDRKEYLKIRPKDIAMECHLFNLTGRCPRGITCRMGSRHMTEDGFNIIDEKKFEEYTNRPPAIKNHLSKDLQNKLRKRYFNFSKAEAIVKVNDPSKNKTQLHSSDNETEDKKINIFSCDNPRDSTKEFKLGPVDDSDLIKLRQTEKKRIDWNGKILLSPLTTVGNLPFRRICKEYGADITCGEMALAPKILKAAQEEWALVKRHESEDIFGVQLCGNNPGVLTRCAQLLNQEIDVDFIDLNLGCPIDLIYRKGGGSGMLNRLHVLESVVKSISQVLDIPLSVKTRTGVYIDKPIAHQLMPRFRDWGASMITVHGRSREQRYTKLADWEYIEKCAVAAQPIPVFGNGDILSFDDYQRMKKICGTVQGVTIGRGALIKPWIFTEIKERRLIDISSAERFDILKKYANYGLEHWGSDTRGVETTRRFMLEWISFLHRYVPVGILERPPQRINERPPFYRGRDDMETLMASSNCADWVKLSEMLLGKVPDGFHFLPKHKANSWK